MKRLALIIAAALALPACATLTAAPPSIPTAPAVVANRTVLDEKAGIAVETAYKAWRVAIELATDAGMITGAKATRVAEIDTRAYGATLAVQAAYRAGNAAGYIAAAREANAAIRLGLDVVKGTAK